MGGTSMIFNILVKKEEDLFVAHCLELDIVTTSKNEKEVISDILDLVKAQVNYAFSNDNLVHLFHPAPPEVWEEFYACEKQKEQKITIEPPSEDSPHRFIPPWIIARTCTSSRQTNRA